jgi:hypothetical protein
MEEQLSVNRGDFRRIHERKDYNPHIVFAHENQLYSGNLKNISIGGAFIVTPCVNQFSKKDIVTISIPFSAGRKNIKRKGTIRWLNNEGFAVEFI